MIARRDWRQRCRLVCRRTRPIRDIAASCTGEATKAVHVTLSKSRLADITCRTLTPSAGAVLTISNVKSPTPQVLSQSRGFAADYDEWAQHAGHDWKFCRGVEYFTRIEKLEGAREPDEGHIGPLYISRQRSPRRSTAAWLAAVRHRAMSSNDRIDTGQQLATTSVSRS